MCGRYSLGCTGNQLYDRVSTYNLEITTSKSSFFDHPASYNVAPTQEAPVYTAEHELKYMKWGLVPHWARDMSSAQQYKTFNARKENLSSSKMWTAPCNHNRCVVPITGYYEWQNKGKTKIPYYLTRKDRRIMFLAGMYDCVKSKEFFSYTIITGPAPPNMQWLHFRMPVVLEPNTKQWDEWLNPSKTDWTQKELADALKTECDENTLEWWRVNTDVGKVTNNGEYLIEPVNNEVHQFFKGKIETVRAPTKKERTPFTEKKSMPQKSSLKHEDEQSLPKVKEVFEGEHVNYEPRGEKRENGLKQESGSSNKSSKSKKRSIKDMLRSRSSGKRQKLEK